MRQIFNILDIKGRNFEISFSFFFFFFFGDKKIVNLAHFDDAQNSVSNYYIARNGCVLTLIFCHLSLHTTSPTIRNVSNSCPEFFLFNLCLLRGHKVFYAH